MTGYVSYMVQNKQRFEQFAFSCARAFGALISLRDEPNDAPIPDKFTPNDYHWIELAKAGLDVERLRAMSPAEQHRYGIAKRLESIESYRDALSRAKAENKPILAMLDEVRAWIPPTPDHADLKKFMEEQLTTSLADETYWLDCVRREEERLPADYYRTAIETAEHSVTYHREHWEKEQTWAKGRTEWLTQLRQSLSKNQPTAS